MTIFDISAFLTTGAGTLILMDILKPLVASTRAKWGNIWVHVLLLFIATLVASIGLLMNLLPEGWVGAIVGTFMTAMTIYEVFIKKTN